MKKIFFVVFALIFFSILPLKFYAQTPKLNNTFNASFGIVADSQGNLFLTGKNNKIIKITPAGKAELFAGGGRFGKDGKANQAGFNDPEGITIDAADNLYVADGPCIRKITPDAVVTTIAGTKNAGIRDGNRQTATFWNIENIAIDNKGNIYVSDYVQASAGTGEFCIRKISTDGFVTTLKDVNDSLLILKYPRGLSCDAAGNLYVCASVSHCIKKISPGGAITTVAGQCDRTKFNSVYKEGNISAAVLTCPSGMTIAKNGDIYITDTRLHRIIKIANNKVTTVAGTGKFDFTGNPAGAAEPGYADGKALSARFNAPAGIAFDRNGNLFIVDASNSNNSYIRKLSTDGIVTTFCKHEWNPKTSQYEEAE
jgi:DNA-binding beta-propeller fold protein YncE